MADDKKNSDSKAVKEIDENEDLTEQQKDALKREEEFRPAAEAFQKSTDPADVLEQRQQV